MINLPDLNSKLNELLNFAPFEELTSQAQQAVNKFEAIRNTDLGKAVGEVVGGFESLNQVVDTFQEVDVPDEFKGLGIGFLTDQVPGLSSDLVQQVGGAASDLNALAEGGVENGFLYAVTSVGTPEAVNNTLKEITGKSEQQLASVLQAVAPEGFKDFAVDGVVDIVAGGGIFQSLTSSISGVQSAIATAIGDVENTLNGIAGNINQEIRDAVGGLTDELLPDNIVGDIINKVVDNKIDDAISTLTSSVSNATGLNINVARDTLTQINPSISSNLTPLSVSTKPREGYKIAIAQDAWPGAVAGGQSSGSSYGTIGSSNRSSVATGGGSTASGDYTFTFVDSYEELVAEFRAATREITEVVAHWTATYNNQDIGSEEVHEWHLARGFSGIGYHYIIRRDGRIQRGRPLNTVGAHANGNGHNRYSIGVSMAGGYNCPSGTANPNSYISADSLTSQQMNSFNEFMRAFYDVWPGGQAWGHVDTDTAGKVDPGFSVPEYVQSRFGKTNVSTTGQTAPLSPTQIAQARGTSSTATA